MADGALDCRLRHQIQVYTFYTHLEGQAATHLLPSWLKGNKNVCTASNPGREPAGPKQELLNCQIAQFRLAQALLGKGAELGLCSITVQQG